MSSSSELQPIKEVGNGTISDCNETQLEHIPEEEDVEEEEDIDFNPFLIASPSSEASSSLSSDIEVLDDDAIGQLQGRDTEFGEESVMQVCGKEKNQTPSTAKKRKEDFISSQATEATHMRKNCESSEANIGNSKVVRNAAGSTNFPVENDEDAISKRTRARYSLASFTLDELETFLQETDDEDDLHNVDDEDEYRKFLAAVLQGKEVDSLIGQDNENVEDEDEENDADFELELEEALESDLEENCGGDIQEQRGVSRRPETRLNKRRKASDKQARTGMQQANRPLRPLLPNTPVGFFPTLMPKTASESLSAPIHSYSNGFTPHQLVQLHCLIHEHVQLLVQVFSLSVLDPSKRHVASQVKDLISVALQTREQVTSRKRAQYPFFSFSPPYTLPYSSVPHRHTSSSIAPSDRNSNLSYGGHREASWLPFENGPILSVLDVAPLRLVKEYMDEISIAVQESRRKCIEFGSAAELLKEPLFPNLNSHTLAEDDEGVVKESEGKVPAKKTLVAALDEKTKKQSIALVPKEIAGLARRFLPIFDPKLFPHKPPPVAVLSRVLFTDSEDELLALGIMECNSDWEAIQQRYLPCKSKHQIYVRQKNRSSSKAPENPIKTVRRMKTSPLTGEEIARIKEGLKVFKLDWMSVWRYVVPYRDPSLLPRQWRIAHGTQRSYTTSEDKKARRRVYELNRRRNAPASLAGWQTSPEKEGCQTDNAGGEDNSGDDCGGRENEAYVHEAFLADWRPGTAVPNPSNLPFSNNIQGHRTPCGLISQSGLFKNSGQSNPNISASCSTSRYGKSQRAPWPSKSRKKKDARVVKLAPDLPPINLPASVRVISQSAFKGCDTDKEVIVKRSSKGSKGTQSLEESHVVRAKCDARDNSQSDLQMHPLLFQASGSSYLPYYPLNSSNSNSSSFNFFSHFQPQLNPNLLCNPHLAKQPASHLNKSSKESTSAVGIDFHPLLQINDDVATDSRTEYRLQQLPANLELFGSSCAQVNTFPCAGNSFTDNCSKSDDVSEKATELDLDIHLSLSRSEMATENRVFNQICREQPPTFFQNRITNNLNSGGHLGTVSGDEISPCGIDVGDQSLTGIVMEQEELSDSEEEIGEHVEFECEEMEDSGGDEESDSEQIKELSNSKEAEGAASEKQNTCDALSLNFNILPKNNSKTRSIDPAENNCPPARPSRSCKKRIEEEHSVALDLLSLNPTSNVPRNRSRRNTSSGSNASSCRKRVSDLNTKPRKSARIKSGKVDTCQGTNVSVENCNTL